MKFFRWAAVAFHHPIGGLASFEFETVPLLLWWDLKVSDFDRTAAAKKRT